MLPGRALDSRSIFAMKSLPGMPTERAVLRLDGVKERRVNRRRILIDVQHRFADSVEERSLPLSLSISLVLYLCPLRPLLRQYDLDNAGFLAWSFAQRNRDVSAQSWVCFDKR